VIRPISVLVCESALHDRNSNMMSLINLLEQVRPDGYPALIPRLTIFVLFERDEDDGANSEARVSLFLGDQRLFEDATVDINFGEATLNRNILQLQGLVVPGPGTMFVRVMVGDAQLESYRLRALPPETPPDIQVLDGSSP
jgi:hypothetical protein